MSQPIPVESGFADINGTQLYYEVSGSGQPLVFVHAGIADHRLWTFQVEAFAPHFRVVTYDMRGYGKSAMSKEQFSHRYDLYALLRHLGIERAVFVGCSMGGATLIDFTLEYPDMVAALVTVGSRPHGMVSESDTVPPQWDEVVSSFKAGDLERTSELEVQIWVDGPQRTPDHVDPAVRALVHEMNLIALQNEKLGQGENVPLEPLAATRLSNIRVPFLAIAGELDAPQIVDAAPKMAAAIPGGRVVVMPGTAHVPSLEKPDEFNRILVEFLKTLG